MLGNLVSPDVRVCTRCPSFVAALYTLDGEPWLLDARAGRPDDLVPTVLALWRLPALLPAVPLRHAAVSHFILSASAPRLYIIMWKSPLLLQGFTAGSPHHCSSCCLHLYAGGRTLSCQPCSWATPVTWPRATR